MKRSRKKTFAPPPTPEQLQQFVERMADEHQIAWQSELLGNAPYWEYLLGLHLRLVELEHMGTAVEELL